MGEDLKKNRQKSRKMESGIIRITTVGKKLKEKLTYNKRIKHIEDKGGKS